MASELYLLLILINYSMILRHFDAIELAGTNKIRFIFLYNSFWFLSEKTITIVIYIAFDRKSM